MAIQELGEKRKKRKPPAKAKPRTMAKAAKAETKYGPVPEVTSTRTRKGKSTLRKVLGAIGAAFMAFGHMCESIYEYRVVALCISPSLAANLLPRAYDIFWTGKWDIYTVVMAIFQTVTVIVMAMCAIRIAQPNTWGKWLAALVLGSILFAVNTLLSLETTAHIREAAASGPLKAALRVKVLNDTVKHDTETSTAMGDVAPVSEDQVTSAREAVEAAKKAQDQECTRTTKKGVSAVGDNCRARQKDTKEATEALNTVSAARARSVKYDGLQNEIQSAQTEINKIGPVPAHADPIAFGASGLFGGTEAWWSDKIPTFFGIVAELIGILGPIANEKSHHAPTQPKEATEGVLGRWYRKKREQGEEAFSDDAEDEPAIPGNVVSILGNVEPVFLGQINLRHFYGQTFDVQTGGSIRNSRVNKLFADYCKANGFEIPSAKAFSSKFQKLAPYDPKGGYPVYLDLVEKGEGQSAAL